MFIVMHSQMVNPYIYMDEKPPLWMFRCLDCLWVQCCVQWLMFAQCLYSIFQPHLQSCTIWTEPHVLCTLQYMPCPTIALYRTIFAQYSASNPHTNCSEFFTFILVSFLVRNWYRKFWVELNINIEKKHSLIDSCSQYVWSPKRPKLWGWCKWRIDVAKIKFAL